MDIRITSRRATVGDALLVRAHELAEKLEKYELRLQTVSLLFDEDHGRFSVEMRAEVPGVPTLVARSEADSYRAALDRVVDKMRRRLRRERKKRVQHQAPPAAAIITG